MDYSLLLQQHANTLFSAYNGVQWSLAQWQKFNPSIAGKVFNIQQALIFGDCAEFGYKGYRLHQVIKYGYHPLGKSKKENPDLDTYEMKKRNSNLEAKREKQFFIAFIVSSIFIVAFVYFTRSLLAPSVDLKALSTDNITLSWDVPWAQIVIQSLFLMRVATNMALAYLTGEKQLYLHAGLQANSFQAMQQLSWINMKTSYAWPLKHVPYTRADRERNYARAIERINLSIDFLCPTTCTHSNHYETAVERIKAFCSNLFQDSHWNSYTYYRLEEIGDMAFLVKKFANVVTVQPKDLSVGCCKKALHNSSVNIGIKDRFLDAGERVSSIIFQ